MKINGKNLSDPYVVEIIMARGDDQIVFKAKAVLDYTPFEKLVPFPTAPTRQMAGGDIFQNVEDPEYKKKVSRRGLLRHYWMLIQSLTATPGLEFELVKLDTPDTWEKFDDELAAAGFTPFDAARIVNGIMEANGLNDAKIKKAERDFLAKRAVAAQAAPLPPSPIAALRSIQSGEPANGPK